MIDEAALHSKTTLAPAASPRRGKSSQDNGLTHSHRLGCRGADETSRKTIEGISQHIPDQTHASLNRPNITKVEATDASDLEPNPFLFDGQRSCFSDSRKTKNRLGPLLDPCARPVATENCIFRKAVVYAVQCAG